MSSKLFYLKPFSLIYNQSLQLRVVLQKLSLGPISLGIQSDCRHSLFLVRCSLCFLESGINDGVETSEGILTGDTEIVLLVNAIPIVFITDCVNYVKNVNHGHLLFLANC